MTNAQEPRVTAETLVTGKELSKVLGLTMRRIQQLTQDGTLETEKKGHFLLAASVQKYIAFITGKNMSAKEKKLEEARKSAEVKMKIAKATVAQLEADEMRGTMHRSEDVEAVTTDLVMAIRDMLTSLPGQLAVDVSNATSAEECSIIIRDAVYAIMEELSRHEYDPTKYEELVRQRLAWRARHDEQDADEDD